MNLCFSHQTFTNSIMLVMLINKDVPRQSKPSTFPNLCEELKRRAEKNRRRNDREPVEIEVIEVIEEEEDMSGGGDGPKLYNTKPKKSQLKQSQKVRDMSTPPPTPNPIPPSPSPPPLPPTSASSSSTLPPYKESFARRYKFVWPVLLTVNLAIGAYIFVRAKKKDPSTEDVEVAVEIPSTPVASTTAPVTAPEKPYISPIIAEPVKLQQAIPEKQQRELYKWMLEEKRKVKPKTSEEKKKLDEEKALLKQVLRSKSLPSI